MAKDRKPASGNGRPVGDRRPAGSSAARPRGRTRPAAVVVAPQRPWGLIAAALAVVVFAVAVITYATVQVNNANAGKVTSADQIGGVQSFSYGKGQGHVPTEVAYTESPPVGGQHDGVWADCTGTVYDVNIRNENAVHSLEHGALWITYDPALVSKNDIAALSDLVKGTSGRMLSPRPGLGTAVSLQSWDRQLTVDSATDPRVKQFADFFTYNPDSTPELGATCESPQFLANPIPADPSDPAAASTGAPPSTPPAAGSTPPTGAP